MSVSLSHTHSGDFIYTHSVLWFDAQDPLNPAKSILYGGKVGKKWLCSASDKSGCLEMVVELCKRSKITIIEVGKQKYSQKDP